MHHHKANPNSTYTSYPHPYPTPNPNLDECIAVVREVRRVPNAPQGFYLQHALNHLWSPGPARGRRAREGEGHGSIGELIFFHRIEVVGGQGQSDGYAGVGRIRVRGRGRGGGGGLQFLEEGEDGVC